MRYSPDSDDVSQVHPRDAVATSYGRTERGEAVFDKVAQEFRDANAELIRTNLSDEDEARLREAFAEE